MTQKSRYLPNTFQTFNFHVDEMMEYLTGDEYKVLNFTVRHILGWQSNLETRTATISLTMFEVGYDYVNDDGETVHMGGTGLGRNALTGILDSLVNFGLMVKVGDPTPDGQRWKLGMSPDWEKLLKRAAEREAANRQRIEKANAARLAKRAGQSGSSHEPVSSDEPANQAGGSSHDMGGGSSHEPDGGSSDELNQTHENPYKTHDSISPTGAVILDFQDVKDCWDKKTQTWSDPAILYIGSSDRSKKLEPSIWANPHVVNANVPRGEAQRRYRLHVLTDPDLITAIPDLIGKTLVQKDGNCHGEVLVELVAAYIDGTLPDLVATTEKTFRKREPVLEAIASHMFELPDPTALNGHGSVIGSFEKCVYERFMQRFGVYNWSLAVRSVERYAEWVRAGKRSMPRYISGFEPDYVKFIQLKDRDIRDLLHAEGTPATTAPISAAPAPQKTQDAPEPAGQPDSLTQKLRARLGGTRS